MPPPLTPFNHPWRGRTPGATWRRRVYSGPRGRGVKRVGSPEVLWKGIPKPAIGPNAHHSTAAFMHFLRLPGGERNILEPSPVLWGARVAAASCWILDLIPSSVRSMVSGSGCHLRPCLLSSPNLLNTSSSCPANPKARYWQRRDK